ncbi:hypothetical protein [Stenotrophomonas sp. VV52]|uniref:hypothetical protein n=1 Tax=Stenotrophomonas sp. VV52 TaxID=2066958 RepID=UPI0011AF3E17|nr:hypothetical protein [Stenotrophomonas sp. VV52]
MTTSRRVLSLTKNTDSNDADAVEVRVPVGIFDVQLPARQFLVHHKVAEVGDVSLTTEFLLRLLYSADGIQEDAAAHFFGFNANEMAYVIRDAETRAYISRSEGRIWLTDAGQALFKEGDKPQIYDVVKKMDKIGFDLLSLAPCDREYQSDFERALPELRIRNPELAATASKHVPESFRRFYVEIASRKERDAADILKRSLYSVDEVVAGDRFSTIVPFVAIANVRRPGEPEPFLDAWKVGHELSDRDQVVHGIAEYLENLRTSQTAEDANAFDTLVEFAPSYLKEYSNKSGFAALRYFKETAGRAGELRSHRPTVGIVGALYQPENIERVATAIGYTKDRMVGKDDAFVWVMPNQAAWGASRSFRMLLERLAKEGASSDSSGKLMERTPVVVGHEKPAWHLVKALPATYIRPKNGAIPSSLEILLVPGRMAAITVHAPVTESRGFPVPLGILSFDEATVRRVHQYLAAQLPPKVTRYGAADGFALRDSLDWPVDAGSQEGSNSLDSA